MTSQFDPEYPEGQLQMYLDPDISHVPPFRHEFEVQGVTSQFDPEYPEGQLQMYLDPDISHVPPF